MPVNVAREIVALRKMTVGQLRARYTEVFGETTNAGNRDWLVKRIAWRLQANAEGDLSERARRRAAELANDADLRLSPPQPRGQTSPSPHVRVLSLPIDQERLPPPGSVITRVYKGEMLQVRVLDDAFEFEGERYRSLSAVAKAATGQHLNGLAFFRIGKEVAS
jgi:hypothetical protein